MTSIPISQAKNELTRIIHDVENGQAVQLTRHGKAAAVLLSSEDYLELLSHKTSFSSALEKFRSRSEGFYVDDGFFENLRSFC